MKLELCAASVAAIKLAKELNFDRIELCENLVQGGITPSAGRILFAVESGVETHVLIRPRPGGFNYSSEEIKVMSSDIKFAKSLGAKGVVVGALNNYGAIDEDVLEQFMTAAQGMEVTYHRAFDDGVLDWSKPLDILIKHGVNRLLSSGLSSNITNGIDVLKEMKIYADRRIEIMAGGGVSAGNVAKIITDVNPDAIHFSGTVKTVVDEESFFSETFLAVDENRVRRILQEIESTLHKIN